MQVERIEKDGVKIYNTIENGKTIKRVIIGKIDNVIKNI